MPPATTVSASPALIYAAAIITDFRPEPQTRLMVVARDRLAQAGPERRLTGRRLAHARLEDLAHQDLVDMDVLRQAGSVDRSSDGDPAELHGRRGAEPSAELADGRPSGTDEVDMPVRAGPLVHGREATPGARGTR